VAAWQRVKLSEKIVPEWRGKEQERKILTFLFLPYYLLVMPLIGQTQCKARGHGNLGAAVHRSQPSGAKIREEKDREENVLVTMKWMGANWSNQNKCYARNPGQWPVTYSGSVRQSQPSFSQSENNFKLLPTLC